MADQSKQSQDQYKEQIASILLCIFCQHNLCCRLWQDGRKYCKSFQISRF